MKVEKVSLSLLKPYWRNPRQIDDAVDAVTQSIKDYGYHAPIAVDSDYTIVVGHARYRALQRLGYESVDVVVLDLSPQQIREYRIADNKTAELAEWDEEKLLKEVMSLEDPEFVRQYFTEREIEDFFPDLAETEVPEEPDALRGGIPGSSTTIDISSSNGGTGSSEFGAERSSLEEGENGEVGAWVQAICPECGNEEKVWVTKS